MEYKGNLKNNINKFNFLEDVVSVKMRWRAVGFVVVVIMLLDFLCSPIGAVDSGNDSSFFAGKYGR